MWTGMACHQKHTINHKDALLKTRKISRIEISAKILDSEDSLVSTSEEIGKLSVSMVRDSLIPYKGIHLY